VSFTNDAAGAHKLLGSAYELFCLWQRPCSIR
jgi:hypothetical protein